MKIKTVLFRFFVGYSMLLLVAGFFLKLSGLPLNSASNIPAFYLAFGWAISTFAKKNNRYLGSSEKATAAVGAILIALGFQCLLGYTNIIQVAEFAFFLGKGPHVFFSEIFLSSKFAVFIFAHILIAYASLVSTQKSLSKKGAVNI